MKKAALHNLGCKVNAYETEAMQQLLEKGGFEIVPFSEKADVYIINTCTVTNIADRKSRQMLHRAKKMNPEAIVVAAGCYVQASKEQLKEDDCVDIIIGNNKKKDLLTIIQEFEQNSLNSDIIEIDQTKEYEELSLDKTAEHTRAYIKVQDGCNQFCSYCIIPYTRGRARSRKKEDIKNEIERLVQNGFKEVVLTGIHLSSYGIETETDDLLTLIQEVHKIDGIQRIRLGSLEPRIITEEFVKTVSNLPKFCPHFHLSLQSGCEETLKRMNRKYTSQEYYDKVTLLRSYLPNLALTTDVIVGFPGESEEEFQKTKTFLTKIDFYEMHIFKYSRRKGTQAAKMEGQVDDSIKQKRSNELLALTEEQKGRYLNRFINKKVEVLIEEEVLIKGQSYQIGYTKEYVKVAVIAEHSLANQLITGTVERRLDQDILYAHVER